MTDTQCLPLKFVFHTSSEQEPSWYFDLTDLDQDGCVGLYDWDRHLSKPLEERYGGWTVLEIVRVVRAGNWIIDFEICDASSIPEVNDLL